MKDPKSTLNQHIQIESLGPVIDCGRYPVKRIVGESCVVEADIFRYGHDVLRAVIKWRRKQDRKFSEVPMVLVNWGLDHWSGQFPLKENGRYVFTVEAWTDRFSSWAADLKKKVEAGQESVASEVSEGLRLVRDVQRSAKGRDRKSLDGFITKISESVSHPPAVLELALRDELSEIMTRLQKREDSTLHKPFLEVDADRPKARLGSWYEIFVRSQGKTPGKGATFRDAEWRLPDIRDMGFDVLYLAPIHPIGTTNRKGRNNTIRAGKLDPGSPWAIGSKHGGFTAVEPSLGTLSDFDHFVQAAKRHGLEVALDFALQCSPDHPWVREHPEWFYHRPDGTIKYAENPPKKYEDIYPINFHTENWKLLWKEIRKIILFWIGHGVKIFRVDNPHTKPTAFWQWLIEEIHAKHPDVIFLSEAFTRPRVMHALAKAGFTQSYTYFTWRNTKSELTEYLTELTQSGVEQYLRPNFFVNTPDILHEFLQKGGTPAFKTRLVLAATLSPSYGIYSGFELCENEAKEPGSEEYLNSEKYEIRVRDWNKPGNIKDLIRKVNAIRRENPALQYLANLKSFSADSDQMLFYGKVSPDKSNVILVVVNLDPFHPQQCTVSLPLEEIGVPKGGTFEVTDLLTGGRYTWGERNFVRLDPQAEPAHILRVERSI